MKYLKLTAIAALPLLASGRRPICGNAELPIPQSMYDVGNTFGRNLTTGTQQRSIFDETIVISTYIHFVSSSKISDGTTNPMIQRQFEVLNLAYKKTGFQFRLDGTTQIYNKKWSKADIDHADKKDMKKALRKGTYKTLNLYFVDHIKGGFWGSRVIGRCPFPADLKWATDPEKYKDDGCVILIGTMPGGNMKGMNLGYTAVHEVGHFLGLFHVFQGLSCTGAGDMVDDTPIQSEFTNGCPVTRDSCKGLPGVDSIHNFMDYSDDICMEGLTAGQITRMKQQWWMYRANK